MKKKYYFKVTQREAFDGTKFPDHESGTFKSKRKAEIAAWNFNCLENKTCGGSASLYIGRKK